MSVFKYYYSIGRLVPTFWRHLVHCSRTNIKNTFELKYHFKSITAAVPISIALVSEIEAMRLKSGTETVGVSERYCVLDILFSQLFRRDSSANSVNMWKKSRTGVVSFVRVDGSVQSVLLIIDANNTPVEHRLILRFATVRLNVYSLNPNVHGFE